MKKRLNDLLNGKFEYEPEGFDISEERIEGSVLCGENFRGKFSIRAHEGKSVQGFLYSTNVRAGFAPAMFFSGRETFSYEFDTRGMKPGSVLEGAFILCTASGEYTLPYRIAVEGQAKKEMAGKALSLSEFAELARNDFGEAYVLFVSREFPKLLERWDASCRALYENIRGQAVSYHSLEQFLVGSGQKQPVRLTLENDHIYLRDVEETTREEIIVTKSGWGFSRLSISSDSDFLTIERQQVTTEEFVGSIYNISYLIHAQKLHAGRNFARIRIVNGCEEHAVVVEARRNEELVSGRFAHRQKQEITGMMSAYIDYRAKRVGQKEWLGLSLSYLENYRKAGGNHIFFDLYEILLRYRREESLEAELLMQQVTGQKNELVVPQWKGLYLYLTTFHNQDQAYVEYVRDEVARLFLENQENWILQGLMFRLNGHLIKNDTEKLDLIRRQYLGGCKSPLMYLEAVDILKKEPLMLRSLGDFEVHLLRFICRERLLDREICGQTAQLAARCQNFEPLLFEILCRCYEVYPTKNMLTAICTMLIKGHKNTKAYAKWYELGVMQDVRITGLYEYYVETMEEFNDRLLPQAVRMYFMYHNTLDYVRKAAIYANIIRNRTRDAITYENYRSPMELFMEEQLLAGRMNRDIALICDVLLTRQVLDEPLAEGLSKALFTYEIRCDNPRIKNVIVVHEQLRQEQRATFANGRAYVRIYSPDCSILLEDGEGNRYADGQLYQKERLLTRPAFEDYCREILEESTDMVVSDCCRSDREEISRENVARFVQLLGVPEVKNSYRRQLEKRLLEFYSKDPSAKCLYEFLQLADDAELEKEHRGELAELLISEGMGERAYELVKRYGIEEIKPQTLVRICNYCVQEREYEEDELLTAICAQCFFAGTYEQEMLKYLLRYYEGPIEYMKKLWRAGQGFYLEAFVLEERILTMLLFERSGMEDTEEIFCAYRQNQGKAKICRAYVTLMSYRYFVQDLPVREPVFSYMEQVMMGSVGVADVCRLALLKFYALQKTLSPGQKKWLYYLLRRYNSQGMRFRIYKRLSPKIQREFHLEDKFIVEHRAAPDSTVILHYQLNEEKEQSVVMKNTFEGIFTKEFTLFYLDKLTWYFTVETKGGKTDTEKFSFSHTRRSPRGSTSRYDLINRMIEARNKKDEALYREIQEQYIGQQYLVDELFG